LDRIREDAIDVVDLASKLPISLNAEELHELPYAINLMRVTVDIGQAPSPHFKVFQEVSRRAETNLAALRKDLPKLIRFHREFGSEKAAESVEVLATILSAADEYSNESWNAWGGRTPPRRHKWWHDDVIYLAFVLDRAARRQDAALSFSHPKAEAIVFIDAALTRAKVKHGHPEAIAQALVRYFDRRKKRLEAVMKDRHAIPAT
jgi:hypothetical protein